jgi:hypothetical protein
MKRRSEEWWVEMRTGGRDELRNNRLLLCCEGARLLLVLHSWSEAPERREGGGACRCRAHCERWMQRTQRLLLLPYKRCQPKLRTMSERGNRINPNYGSSFLFVWGGGEGAWGEGCSFFFFFFGELYLCSGLGPLRIPLMAPLMWRKNKTFREFLGVRSCFDNFVYIKVIHKQL